MKKVCIAGLGYIGLPTALVAAQVDLQVIGVDIDEQRVKTINAGISPIEEHGIEQELYKALQRGFKAQTKYEHADYYVIAVPTPFTSDNKADLSYVFGAVHSIAQVLTKGDTVILESTVPVGTTQKITALLAQETKLIPSTDFFVAHCPERVLPGNIFHELHINDRIIGGIDRGSTRQAAIFYNYFVSGDLYLTTAETAEMAKLVENSYRDVNIAISHQVASMATSIGLNPYEVIELANKHPRVKLLNPTCGVGGHCLAVDPWFLVETFPEHTALLKTAREVNNAKPYEIVQTIKKEITKWKQTHNKETCTFLLLGLTYKANVDDIRESPAMLIAKELVGTKDFTTLLCDPHVEHKRLDTTLAHNKVTLAEGLEKADIIACLVGHSEFKVLDKKIFAHTKVLDFCGLFYTPKKYTGQEQEVWSKIKSATLVTPSLSPTQHSSSKSWENIS